MRPSHSLPRKCPLNDYSVIGLRGGDDSSGRLREVPLWKQVAKRIARRPMSESDLLGYCGPLIANPPIPDEIRSALMEYKYTGGRTALEKWRDDIKYIIRDIADDKTWSLQRQKLIHYLVAAVHWVALFETIDELDVQRRTGLWRDYVEGIGVFAANQEDEWPLLLILNGLLARINKVVLSLLGMAYYGTNKNLERHLDIFMGMRKHVIEKAVLLDRGILDIDATDYDLGASLIAARNEQVFPALQKLFALLREFGDRIETGLVDENSISMRWQTACEECNTAIQALGPLAQKI